MKRIDIKDVKEGDIVVINYLDHVLLNVKDSSLKQIYEATDTYGLCKVSLLGKVTKVTDSIIYIVNKETHFNTGDTVVYGMGILKVNIYAIYKLGEYHQ